MWNNCQCGLYYNYFYSIIKSESGLNWGETDLDEGWLSEWVGWLRRLMFWQPVWKSYSKSTWFWRWLPQGLSKRQSSTSTVLLRSLLTQTISFNGSIIKIKGTFEYGKHRHIDCFYRYHKLHPEFESSKFWRKTFLLQKHVGQKSLSGLQFNYASSHLFCC